MRYFIVFYLIEDYNQDFGGVKSQAKIFSSDKFSTKIELIRHGKSLSKQDESQGQ